MTPGYVTRVDHFPSSHEEQLVEKCDNIAPWLVDSEHNSAVVIASQGYKTVNDIEGVVRIETYWVL